MHQERMYLKHITKCPKFRVYYAKNDLQIKHKFCFISLHKRSLLKGQAGWESFMALIRYYSINPWWVCRRPFYCGEPESYGNQIEKYKSRIPNGTLSRLQMASIWTVLQFLKGFICVTELHPSTYTQWYSRMNSHIFTPFQWTILKILISSWKDYF